MKYKIKSKYKHVIAIILFMIGAVILHVVNSDIPYIRVIFEGGVFTPIPAKYVKFFGIPIKRCIALDLSLVLVGIAFFIEFLIAYDKK